MDWGVIVIMWLTFGVVAAFIAHARGANGWAGFGLGALFGPLGAIAAFALGNRAVLDARAVETGASKVCPMCAETVKRAAVVCRFCGHGFASEPEVQAAATPAIVGTTVDQKGSDFAVFIALIAVAAVLVAVIMMGNGPR